MRHGVFLILGEPFLNPGTPFSHSEMRGLGQLLTKDAADTSVPWLWDACVLVIGFKSALGGQLQLCH